MHDVVSWAVIIGLFIGGTVMLVAVSARDSQTLSACAKKHNIYECEFVAMPKNQLTTPE